jgi:ATP-dependent Clp protease ATP-binding subunit ClpA
MRAPHSVIVLDRIEQAKPEVIERLVACWRSGVILDPAGIRIPTDAAIFLLTTAVAQDRLGQIGRDDLSADQRHLTCLKIMSDEGMPAHLLRRVDAAFCLEGMSMHDLARACRQRLEQQVAAHGLILTGDGLAPEVLACAMTSALGVSALTFKHRRIALDRRLAQSREMGVTHIRLVMDGDEIGAEPIETLVAAGNRRPDQHY